LLPAQNTPLLPDYVKKKSQGIANAYSNMVITVAVILSTTGALIISTKVDYKLIFISIGLIAILCSLVLICGIKDIKLKSHQTSNCGKTMITTENNQHSQFLISNSAEKKLEVLNYTDSNKK
jgi:predicted MFS family arabinose efflux permease